MAPNAMKIFLKEVDKIKGDIEQREDIEDIIKMYQDVKKTKQDIMDSFFLNLWEQEKTKYERALQDVVKENIGEELFKELRKNKSIYHGTKDEWLTGGNYYKSLVADKGEEEVKKLYTENAKKWVEAKWLIPRSDEEKDYIIQHKAEWKMTNNEIAAYCNNEFVETNQWVRTGEKVAQWYYKYNQKIKKVNLLDNNK